MYPPDKRTQLHALQYGELDPQGKFLWGSNYTMLVEVHHEDQTLPAVYKPVRGERPLWDFPAATLAGREVAAFLVSESLGWDMVPATVFRQQGPHGPGSLQTFIDHDPEYHYFNFRRAHIQRLRPVVLFDLLINNADRKGSHVLVDADDRLWLIDHGICFHAEDKLRTVVWNFAGEPIPDDLCGDLVAFRQQLDPPSELVEKLRTFLTRRELGALAKRADRLIATGFFPRPHPNSRPYPWPPV